MNDKKKLYILIGVIALIVVVGIVLACVLTGPKDGGNSGDVADGQTVGTDTGDVQDSTAGTDEEELDGTVDGTDGTEDTSAAEGTGSGSESGEDEQTPTTGKEPSIGVEVEPGDIEVEIGVDTTEDEDGTEPTGGVIGGNMIDFDDLLG